MPRSLSLWLPVVVWAALIFGLSSIPSLNSGLGTWDTVLRKFAHAAEYGVLAALLWRALRNELAALVVAVAYAAGDEFHQSFVPSRGSSLRDVFLDFTGAVFFQLVIAIWLRRRADRAAE